MSKSSFVDKTAEFTSSLFGKTMKSATSSKSSHSTIKEINEIQNVESMETSTASIPNEIQESTLRSHGGKPDGLPTNYASNQTKRVVLKVDVQDDVQKRKALKSISRISGIESLAMDMKDKKLTVTGDIDPVDIVGKLKKYWHTEVVSVGPAKAKEEKKDDTIEHKESDKKKEEEEEEALKKLVEAYKNYNPPQTQHYYNFDQNQEEHPKACVIC